MSRGWSYGRVGIRIPEQSVWNWGGRLRLGWVNRGTQCTRKLGIQGKECTAFTSLANLGRKRLEFLSGLLSHCVVSNEFWWKNSKFAFIVFYLFLLLREKALLYIKIDYYLRESFWFWCTYLKLSFYSIDY